MSAFPLPVSLVTCRVCGGGMQANILPKRAAVTAALAVTAVTKRALAVRSRARTYLVICRACDKAAVAPGWMEGHLDELEMKDRLNAQLRILR